MSEPSKPDSAAVTPHILELALVLLIVWLIVKASLNL